MGVQRECNYRQNIGVGTFRQFHSTDESFKDREENMKVVHRGM